MHLSSLLKFIPFLFLAYASHAARIEWNACGRDSDVIYIYFPFFSFAEEKSSSALTIWSTTHGSYMEWDLSVVSASRGDTISGDYFASQTSYFYKGEGIASAGQDDTAQEDYPIVINDGESVFIAASVTTYLDPNTPLYAWLELGIDDNDSLVVLRSAIDLDGDAVVVGWMPNEGVPEPSSALLLLVGGALLSLRRTHGFRDCAPTRRFHSCLRDMMR